MGNEQRQDFTGAPVGTTRVTLNISAAVAGVYTAYVVDVHRASTTTSNQVSTLMVLAGSPSTQTRAAVSFNTTFTAAGSDDDVPPVAAAELHNHEPHRGVRVRQVGRRAARDARVDAR